MSEKNSCNKYDESFACKLNSISCVMSVVVIVIGVALFVVLFYGEIPAERKIEEAIEYSTNSSAAFITFIICVSCVLAVTIICVSLLAINVNKNELKRKKLCGLKCEKDILKSLLKEGESKLNETIEDEKTMTEYYPKNKAVADIFKAYASAVADL